MIWGLCRWGVSLLAAAYVLALAIGLVGTFGWLGQARDPLAWVFVVVLGQPWVAWIDGVSEPLRPWLAALCPLLNLLLLAAICRLVAGARRPAV